MGMKIVAQKPESLTDAPFHYCPGCTHGIIHRLVAECLDELNIREQTIGICPVGCAVLAYDYFNCDMLEAAHGRAPAIATGIKRVLPDRFVFTYQGDGDLASIGMAEIVHASARGESITVIFVNNAIYGMTGGQMAPTTLLGQVTTTSPYGRTAAETGYPLKWQNCWPRTRVQPIFAGRPLIIQLT
jgi:2-oxoglutarate ferredoxin oxidoreductase subunit beta